MHWKLLLITFWAFISVSSYSQEPDSSNKPLPDSAQIMSPDSLTGMTQARQADSTVADTMPSQKFDLQYYYTIKDSTAVDSATVQYFMLENEWFMPAEIKHIDTTLRDFHYTNPVYEKQNFYQSLGNTGLAAKNLYYDPEFRSGFRYGIRSFDLYNVNENALRFYNTLLPYSKAFYKMAPDKEQILNFVHSQSVYNTVTLGMDVQIINSVGAYLNQKSQDRRVGLTGHYISDNKRYTAAAFYSHNKYDIKENGGIADEAAFENNEETDRLLFDINLTDANNLTKDATLYYRHSFELSPTKTSADSAEMLRKTPFNFGRVSHTFKYYRQGFSYQEKYNRENEKPYFYQNYYDDTVSTHDSSYYHTIENTFSWKNSRLYRTKKSLGFDFGITHRVINFQDSIKNFVYNQFVLHGRMSKTLYGDLKIGGEAEYVQGDINENDFRISGILQNKFGEDLILRATLDQVSREPDFFYNHYYSNNFRWDNNLDKENIIKAGGEITWNNIRIGGNYFLLTNYTYLNEDALPEQAGKSFSLIQAYLFPELQFGHFSWDTYLYLQKGTDENFIRVPFAAGKTAFSYHNSLFDNALYYQVGLNVMYRDLHYADQYMPALKSFFHQDRRKIGNYFYGDAYVSIRIKRARLILKYRHLNEGVTPYKYYDTPTYPMKDSGLEFSVSWRFYN
ncbi:MAG: putative porin [Bacteroidota bacterium]